MYPESTTKRCPRCGRSDVEFGRDKNSPDGLSSWCKACKREDMRQRYASDPDMRRKAQERAREQRQRLDTQSPEYLAKRREYSRRYNQTEKGKAANRAKMKRLRQTNPAVRAYHAQYEKRRRLSDPAYNERWLAYKRRKSQEWKEQHPEDTRERARRTNQRRSADPGLRAKYTKYERERRQERQKTDPAFHEHLMDLAKRGSHKRRALLAETDGTYTRAEWRQLCDYYDHRCVCCGEQFQRLTVDHVIPLSKGGRNVVANLQPLCRSCNSKKHDKAIDYRPSLPPWMEGDD